MRTSLQMQIFIVGLLFLRSRLVFNIGPLGSPTSRGEFETKPGRNLENQGASFPPGKQKQSFSRPGPFHEKRNNYVVLFPRFLVHFGAPGKQSLKSPCFVSSYFPCFNFFPNPLCPPVHPRTCIIASSHDARIVCRLSHEHVKIAVNLPTLGPVGNSRLPFSSELVVLDKLASQ